MTKPHEKTWTLEQSGVIRIDDATTLTVHIAPWRLPRVPELDDWEMAEKVSGEVTALAIASPDMARALLRFVGAGVCANTGRTKVGCESIGATPPCIACEGKAALRKAKVLP